MMNTLYVNGLHFTGASTMPGIYYFSPRAKARATYHPFRKRSVFATAVIRSFCAIVSSVMVTTGVDRNELFEKYDLKLWSYEDHLTLFTLATVPSVVALATIYVSFRGVQGFRLAFGL